MNKIKEILEKYISLNNSIFKELICHLSIFHYGNETFIQTNKNQLISPKVSYDFEIEPISVNQLLSFKKNYPDFIYDVYH